jgi:hypothetical protein
MCLKAPANLRATFARRRSGVRNPSAPLEKVSNLQDKLEPRFSTQIASGGLVQQRGELSMNVTSKGGQAPRDQEGFRALRGGE